jgi:hypothetical protein
VSDIFYILSLISFPATGGTACAALAMIADWGIPRESIFMFYKPPAWF